MTNNYSFTKAVQRNSMIMKLPPEMNVPKDERDSYYNHFTLRVKSLSEYTDVISKLNRIIRRAIISDCLVYRGHSDASSRYKLIPSIARKAFALERSENSLVTEMISLRPEEFQGVKSNFDLLSKMQHFGVPTRLLDFTYNPFIALYFACCEKNNTDSRVVCTYDTSSSSTRNTIEMICGMYKYLDYNDISLDRILGNVSLIRRYGLYTKEPLMAKPKYSNDRIKHQSAVFMVFNNDIYDYRSRMVVLGKRHGNEKDYLRFPINAEEEHRLEYIREEPLIYNKSFSVNSETLRKLFSYYKDKYLDFEIDNGFGINPKYHFLFKDRFSVRNSIEEISKKTLSNSFISILIEAKYKKIVIEELATVGIDKSFVFPELEYTAEMIKKKYF